MSDQAPVFSSANTLPPLPQIARGKRCSSGKLKRASNSGEREQTRLPSTDRQARAPRLVLSLLVFAILIATPRSAHAQLPVIEHGETVPRDVREMYSKGLQFLSSTQSEDGDWKNHSHVGPGVTGLALMAFLASGEDPNFGAYSNEVRRAVKSIIKNQDAQTGYFGNSMYHHGFAMLGLAEAYGAVDDRRLWSEGDASKQRSIGQSLELAVRAAITSQKSNTYGAWRYSPNSTDADTSVSGAVLVGLLAARNAGIEVPDSSIDRAIAYFVSMTSDSGQVGYSGGIGGMGESLARSSIASLVMAIAHRKDLPKYQATVELLSSQLQQPSNSWPEYTRYYQAQALFQGDVEAWERWNKGLIRQLKPLQQDDGHFTGQLGPAADTSMSLLALALNFRFLPIYER